MKKKLITLGVFLFVSFSIFSHSLLYQKSNGYRDTYWGEKLEEIISDKKLNKKNVSYENNNIVLYYEQSIMMGQDSNVYYNFRNNQLTSISYQISYSEDIEKRLLSKFDSIEKTYIIPTLQEAIKEQPDLPIAESYNEIIEKDLLPYMTADDIYIWENYPTSNSGFGNIWTVWGKKIDKNYSGRIYKIKTNDLTYCFIISNFVDGTIIVIYTKAYEEQF